MHGTSPVILIVEDEQLVALDTARRLEALGYGAKIASSSSEAIAQVQESAPDLVLMDIKLNHGPDGIDAANRIHESTDVPVVYLTAYADDATLERARESAPYGYVLKPYIDRELRATIEVALRRHARDRDQHDREVAQNFLATASALLAESLDYDIVLQRAAELLVPRYGDSCLVYAGSWYAYSQPTSASLSAFTVFHPTSTATPSRAVPGRLVERVMRTGRSELWDASARPSNVWDELGAEHAAALHKAALSPRALLCAPMITAGGITGAILLVGSRPSLRCGEAELVLLEDFAHRFAMALENARLYHDTQRAVQAREEVLAVVSHDLRTPLASILIRAQMLAQGARAPGAEEAIARTAERMGRLMDDLLDAAAMDAGRFSIEPKECSIAQLVSEVVEGLRPVAHEKSVVLESVVLPPAASVRCACDAGRVMQVIGNLVMNAIEVSEPGSTVVVRASCEGTDVRFEVEDSGPGVPPDQVPLLFERFWRAQARRKGAGLGLYIARGIVEAHGGAIGVETRPGGGSTFRFTIPLTPKGAAER